MKKIIQWFDNLHPVAASFLLNVGASLVAFLLIVLAGKAGNIADHDFNEGFLRITASWPTVFAACFSYGWAIFGVLISCVTSVIYAIKYKGLSAGTGEYSGGHVYFLGWVLFLVIILVTYSSNYASAEFEYLCGSQQEFEYYRLNPAEAVKLFIK